MFVSGWLSYVMVRRNQRKPTYRTDADYQDYVERLAMDR